MRCEDSQFFRNFAGYGQKVNAVFEGLNEEQKMPSAAPEAPCS